MSKSRYRPPDDNDYTNDDGNSDSNSDDSDGNIEDTVH
jgi:hypothetical protein